MGNDVPLGLRRSYVRVSGNVQGVGFRHFIAQQASLHSLTGWVRNLSGGDMEMEIQGQQEEVETFLQIAEQGSRFAEVDVFDVQRRDPISEHGFRCEGW